MIAPVVKIFFSTLKSNTSTFSKWFLFVLLMCVPIVIAFISQFIRYMIYDAYVVDGKKHFTKRTDELLKRTGGLRTIFITSAIIGILCGILLYTFPNDNVMAVGVTVAISLVPPLCATDMFMGYYALDRKAETSINIRNSLLLFTINIVSLMVGHKLASYNSN